MFKRLFCKHTYKYYNTRVEHPLFGTYGYNVFQFVCPKCGKETEVSELEIDNAYSRLKSAYNKNRVLKKAPINSSKLSIPRHMNIGICYWSPATTLLLNEYAERGIDLREIDC